MEEREKRERRKAGRQESRKADIQHPSRWFVEKTSEDYRGEQNMKKLGAECSASKSVV